MVAKVALMTTLVQKKEAIIPIINSNQRAKQCSNIIAHDIRTWYSCANTHIKIVIDIKKSIM